MVKAMDWVRSKDVLTAIFIVLMIAIIVAILWQHAAKSIQADVNARRSQSQNKIVNKAEPDILTNAAAGTVTEDISDQTTANVSSPVLKVNGQIIQVPENGSVHEEVSGINGTTRVDISTKSTSTGSSNSSSAINIQTESRSEAVIDQESE